MAGLPFTPDSALGDNPAGAGTETWELGPAIREGFALHPSVEQGTLVVRVSGIGEMAALGTLEAYLKLVLGVALARAPKDVCFDFRQLDFMNSSCLKAFVTFVSLVSQSRPLTFKVRFLTNPKLHWQRRSLEALRRLAPEVVRVDVDASTT
jgi:hypothetical protein